VGQMIVFKYLHQDIPFKSEPVQQLSTTYLCATIFNATEQAQKGPISITFFVKNLAAFLDFFMLSLGH
jgi:hypothetical protein